jgi:uncharacterized UBP type Zn finger protein
VTCPHLAEAAHATPPAAPDTQACPVCLADGYTDWVHLRQCLVCGQVGCCDSSPRRHASAHYAQTGHPVIRSIEPGESWRWCFVDEAIG